MNSFLMFLFIESVNSFYRFDSAIYEQTQLFSHLKQRLHLLGHLARAGEVESELVRVGGHDTLNKSVEIKTTIQRIIKYLPL